jgi:hypothetical protein
MYWALQSISGRKRVSAYPRTRRKGKDSFLYPNVDHILFKLYKRRRSEGFLTMSETTVSPAVDHNKQEDAALHRGQVVS